LAFSISQPAHHEIRRRIDASGIAVPVAALIDGSDPLPTSADLTQALLRKASESELRDIAKREFEPDKIEFRLCVGLYSKNRFRPWNLIRIGDTLFAMSVLTRIALRKYVLDYSNGRFILTDGKRTIQRLMDVWR
jgi:hypothetical protein